MVVTSTSLDANNLWPQVYAESWLLRSQLKADIRTQVRNLKLLFPDHFTGTAQELQSQIQATVQRWVGDGSYLHDVVPVSVCVITIVLLDTFSFFIGRSNSFWSSNHRLNCQAVLLRQMA